MTGDRKKWGDRVLACISEVDFSWFIFYNHTNNEIDSQRLAADGKWKLSLRFGGFQLEKRLQFKQWLAVPSNFHRVICFHRDFFFCPFVTTITCCVFKFQWFRLCNFFRLFFLDLDFFLSHEKEKKKKYYVNLAFFRKITGKKSHKKQLKIEGVKEEVLKFIFS